MLHPSDILLGYECANAGDQFPAVLEFDDPEGDTVEFFCVHRPFYKRPYLGGGILPEANGQLLQQKFARLLAFLSDAPLDATALY